MTLARLAAIAASALLASCGTIKMPASTPVTVDTPAVGEKSLRDQPAAAPAPAKPAAAGEIPQPSAAVEKRAIEYVERMRAIKPAKDAKQAEDYNKQLQEAWKYFADNPSSIHVLRRTLSRELSQQRNRNDFLLLDLGFFLNQRGTPADRELARNALFTLDPAAEIVKFNQEELFQFTQEVAASRDARVLAFIDKAFLKPGIQVRFPEADLRLDAAGTCAFLYGAYGPDSEAHLAAMLKTPVTDKDLARRVLEVLIWVGTPASNQPVKNVLMGAARDSETFMRTATFLMSAGGPQGRAIMLAAQPDDMDLWTSTYYDKIQQRVKRTSFGTLRTDLASNEASKAVLDSDKSRTDLANTLYDQRTVLFRSPPTQKSFTEIQRINGVLNALRYRDS